MSESKTFFRIASESKKKKQKNTFTHFAMMTAVIFQVCR